ncbi:MAG: aminotransferase class I/II-fold pyridoxal phosphate-dependent enzyme, partial [Deltaproteobacteria bacterium]|nr:aminotransferase class I/II-fold pyridoxal phosphate-dependent enzyme [Deltaproteobacteria bacterium]
MPAWRSGHGRRFHGPLRSGPGPVAHRGLLGHGHHDPHEAQPARLSDPGSPGPDLRHARPLAARFPRTGLSGVPGRPGLSRRSRRGRLPRPGRTDRSDRRGLQLRGAPGQWPGLPRDHGPSAHRARHDSFSRAIPMLDHPIAQRLKAEIAARTASGLGRRFLPIQARDGARLVVDGRDMLNFSANDFLGLATDRAAASELARLCAAQGCGAGASRLVTGTTASILAAEDALAAYFGFESCLILGSGFLANLTLIATLFSAKDTLILDKRAHTSTMAGVRHSGAAFHTFRHNRMS